MREKKAREKTINKLSDPAASDTKLLEKDICERGCWWYRTIRACRAAAIVSLHDTFSTRYSTALTTLVYKSKSKSEGCRLNCPR